MSVGKKLGNFYNSRIFPQVVECFIELQSYEIVLELIKAETDAKLKAELYLKLVECLLKQGAEEKARLLLNEVCRQFRA